MTASRRSAMFGAVAAALPASTRAAPHGEHHPSAENESFVAEMHRSMQEMMRGMDGPMTGDPDRDFLTMMIPHHQGAVEMARLLLVHGRDPLTRRLAEEIIASQQAEIASMQTRLRILECGGASQEYPALSGTRGR
jgi:uncharacterized protein (DUF305 family)